MKILNPEAVARDAETLYENKLKQQLESSCRDKFVAIEPESGEFFLGETSSEAIGAARRSYPDRLVHAMRVGHKAAIQLGVS